MGAGHGLAMRAWTMLLMLAACAVGAGCGGDDSTSTSTGAGSSTTANGPTKAQYAAAANKLCDTLDRRVEAVTNERPRSIAELRTFTERLQRVVQDGVRRFEALERPSGAAGQAASAYVAKLRELVDGRLVPALRKIRAAIARRDLQAIQAVGRDIQALDNADLKRLARKAGATGCA